jgi:ribosome biogenesis GTPase
LNTTLLGRVTRFDARVVHVEFLEGPDTGTIRPCVLRGRLFELRDGSKNPVAVGDLVDVSPAGDLPGIESVHARRNFLSRVASSHDSRAQILCANVDQLLNIASVVKPGFSSHRTDRILAACRWHRIEAVLVLNKVDLCEREDLVELRATYEGAGVRVLETSAIDGTGVEELRALLAGKVSVLYGGSGAGKSTLLNKLDPKLKIKEGKISRYWDQGRHTTSYSQLHRLSDGAVVIDTPGIRVFRLHAITPVELRMLWPEIARESTRCRLPDCTHDHEPECAVYEAVSAGRIPPTRYASYLEMLDEIGGKRAAETDEPGDAE